jgi:hypothetical protein
MSVLVKRILVKKQLNITQNKLDILMLFLTDSKACALLSLETIFGQQHNLSSIFDVGKRMLKTKL